MSRGAIWLFLALATTAQGAAPSRACPPLLPSVDDEDSCPKVAGVAGPPTGGGTEELNSKLESHTLSPGRGPHVPHMAARGPPSDRVNRQAPWGGGVALVPLGARGCLVGMISRAGRERKPTAQD